MQKTKLIGSALGLLALIGGGQIAYAATYTMAEVGTHSSVNDCWGTINGKVYNLTSFLSQHSGGRSAIIAICGKDATASFNVGPHSARSIGALAPYLLGEATSTSTTVEATASSSTNSWTALATSTRHHDEKIGNRDRRHGQYRKDKNEKSSKEKFHKDDKRESDLHDNGERKSIFRGEDESNDD